MLHDPGPTQASCCRSPKTLLIVSQATEALKITSKALVDFGVMDGIIPEPSGGAHADPMAAFPAIKTAITDLWAE
jgi:acetyl-CoA carboxylase alpha subunit